MTEISQNGSQGRFSSPEKPKQGTEPKIPAHCSTLQAFLFAERLDQPGSALEGCNRSGARFPQTKF
jgi:hypothetical protein